MCHDFSTGYPGNVYIPSISVNIMQQEYGFPSVP